MGIHIIYMCCMNANTYLTTKIVCILSAGTKCRHSSFDVYFFYLRGNMIYVVIYAECRQNAIIHEERFD